MSKGTLFVQLHRRRLADALRLLDESQRVLGALSVDVVALQLLLRLRQVCYDSIRTRDCVRCTRTSDDNVVAVPLRGRSPPLVAVVVKVVELVELVDAALVVGAVDSAVAKECSGMST